MKMCWQVDTLYVRTRCPIDLLRRTGCGAVVSVVGSKREVRYIGVVISDDSFLLE